jgi:hypothetical protein
MMKSTLTAALSLGLLMTNGASAQSVVEKIESLTANAGIYGNRIPNATFPRAYTEICIVGGGVLSDQHQSGESTEGGNCRPGFTGWVIEQDEREAETWAQAKIDCLIDDMRLPEVFEWQYSCSDATAFGLTGMVDNNEWASNTVTPMTYAGFGSAVPVVGNGSCSSGNWGSAAYSSGQQILQAYRCVR